jgi:uncharacterized protein (UPF0248 family)
MSRKNIIKDILNEIKWRKEFDLEKLEIWYIHRGAPNDTNIISGKEIISIGVTFMETTAAMIPYHRIFRILYKDKIIFRR